MEPAPVPQVDPDTGRLIRLVEILHMTTEEIRMAIAARGGLVTQEEIAALLGVSRQRVGQLIRDHADFPQELDAIGAAGQRIWLLDEVREWHQRRRRRLQKRRQRGSPGAAKLKTTP